MHSSRFSFFGFLFLVACGGPMAGAKEEHAHSAHHAESATMIPSPSPLTPPTLEPRRGNEVGLMFEAFMTPHQEGDEEQNTPASVPQVFRSKTPSSTRAEREAAGHRGHGMLRFSKDMSRVWVDVRIEGIDAKTINMFHIHCGKPGILGPILIDLARATDLQKDFEDGILSVEIRNEHIADDRGNEGVVAAFTQGCVIPSPTLAGIKPVKVVTIAGVQTIASEGELYFNLHTTGQTYYGDIRGQIHPARPSTAQPVAEDARK